MKKTFETIHELINEMLKLGIRNMETNITSTIISTESVQMRVEAREPIRYYWVVCKNGTHIKETMLEAGKEAAKWGKDYCFTAIIKGNAEDFDEEETNFSLEIIDKAK